MNLQIPQEVLDDGPDATAHFLYAATPLGTFLKTAPIRRAIAEDVVLNQWRDLSDTPDFTEGEDALIEDWAKRMPSLHAKLLAIAKSGLSDYAPFDDAAAKKRLLIRMAAYRRITAQFFGSEHFQPCPELGAEPYVEVNVEGLEESLRLGRVSVASYEIDDRREPQFLAVCRDLNIIEIVEQNIAPWIPADQWVTGFADHFARFQRVGVIRKYERESRFSPFSVNTFFDPLKLPEGFVLRRSLEKVLSSFAADGIYGVLMEFGITPYLHTSAVEILDSCEDAIMEVAMQPNVVRDFMLRSPMVRSLSLKTA